MPFWAPLNYLEGRRVAAVLGTNKAAMFGGGAGPASQTVDTVVGFGFEALQSNTGAHNTAVGYQALKANTTGNGNTAFGRGALGVNTDGVDHTAVGYLALGSNVTGVGCTAVGILALAANVAGISNTGLGDSTLRYNVSGDGNVAVGYGSMDDADIIGAAYNVTVGRNTGRALQGSPQFNTFIGESSGNHVSQKVDANNSIAIGANTYTTKNNQAVLGPATVTETILRGAIVRNELSSDPPDPAEGTYVTWMSDGTGAGDDGDIMVKITAGGVTKTATLIDFSALA